jgi:hypothetical protein
VPYERQGGEMSVPVHVRVGAAKTERGEETVHVRVGAARTGGEEARKARLAVS